MKKTYECKRCRYPFYMIIILLLAPDIQSQVESPTLSFNRGVLWQSVFFGKVGPNYNNWGRRGIGLDWPGFDDSWINEDIGGPPSHMVTGGFWIGAKKNNHPDSILVVEDWSMYAGTVSNDAGAKYIMKKHLHKYKNGQNYWLQTEKKEGEEVIESVWEYNMNYTNIDDRERQLPIRVTRKIHQWNGSKNDENYIIYEYVFRNISPEIKALDPTRDVADTLYDFYAMLNYGLHVNSRAWRVLFPSLTEGARNTWFFYDATRKMIYGKADDYPETSSSEIFSYSSQQGPLNELGEPSGEWMAPGFVGLRLLYSSPDKTGQNTRVNKYGWSAGSNSIDLSGPFTGIGALKDKYAVLEDPARAANFVNSPADPVYMRKSRMWSLMSLGPWNILPGDSIVIAVAEIVNGIDFADAVNPNIKVNDIGAQGTKLLNLSADKAKFTYDQTFKGNGLNHPDPPAAPKFSIDYYKGSDRFAANVITWDDDYDNFPDPDDNIQDLVGYNIYRSSYLPIGPWEKVATITKQNSAYYDASTGKYTFVDSSATVGTSYYYSLTAFDSARTAWSVDGTVNIPETKTKQVPSSETSIFANRTITPFRTTFPPNESPDNVVVVPNPFVLGDKYSSLGIPGSQDEIQFVNIPNPCTIRIYTIRGDLVRTLKAEEGTGAIISWNQVTDFGQFVESGIYIFHVDSPKGQKTGKFAIVR